MKKIYLILLVLPLLMQSCLKDQEDFFSEPSAERVDKFAAEVKSVLINASNGWKMEMFPSRTLSYGGYTLFLKFSDASVTVSSELAAADKTEPSLWNINKSSGVVLSFDTYNSLIHYFSGPSKDKGNIDTGLGGDYDFLVIEATPDKVRLKGTKTGNTIVLTPLPAGDWTAMMTEYKNAVKKYTFSSFTFDIKGKSFEGSLGDRVIEIYVPQEDGLTEQVLAPYIYTLTGIKFYRPLAVEGDSISEMNFKQEGSNRYFEAVGGSGAKLKIIIPPLNVQLTSGNWYFAYSKIGPYGKQYWDHVQANGLDAIEEELYYAYLGTLSGAYGFCFASTDGQAAYSGTLGYTYNRIGEDQIYLKFALTAAGNGAWYYNNALFNYYTAALGSSTAGATYTLTSDDDASPTWIKLSDNANPNNYYTLYKAVTYWTYEK